MEPTEKITFSLAQQAMVNKLIDESFGKGLAKGVRAGIEEMNRLKTRILELENKKSILNFWRK